MAISFTRYVDITSGLGGGSIVQNRQLVGRYFTNNALLPPQSFISFDTAKEVGDYFGVQSEEYLRAVFYFSWVSKTLTKPQSIQFARYVQSAIAPSIIPLKNNNSSVSDWTSISSGSFILTMGGSTFTISGLDFSGASNLADVATIVQDEIQAAGSFDLTGDTNGNTTVDMADTTGLVVGMSVIAADISQGTTIDSIVVDTSITLSQAATGSNLGETITFNDPMYGLATVEYMASYSGLNFGGFFLTGGADGVTSNPLVVQAGGGGTDITGDGLLGWLPAQVDNNGVLTPGAIYSTGSAAESIADTLDNSFNASNNFGSFAFLTNLNLSLQNVYDAAIWNQTQNVMFMYSQAVTPANASSWASQTAPGVGAVGGVGLTLSPTISVSLQGSVTDGSTTMSGLSSNSSLSVGMPVSGTGIQTGTVIQSLSGSTAVILSLSATSTNTGTYTFNTLQFPEMFPMMIEAATNYNAPNAVQNYEYQQVAGLTPSVSTDSSANDYDALYINYYGVTQQAGQQIAFYQQGFLQGASIPTNIIDMNAYVNEIWLKDAAGVALMNALLTLTQISVNLSGQSQLTSILQTVIDQALNNGTISVGKTLTTNQKQYITQATNDPLAWYQVQNSGYWVGVNIQLEVSIYVATYTLIYSKNDVVRKIVGTHTLI